MTRLHDAARRGDDTAVSELLRDLMAGDINTRDEGNNTPLWLAAREGHLAVARLLLKHGKSEYSMVNAICESKHTPLSVAVVTGKSNIVKLMLGQPGVQLNTTDHNGHTPLTLAAKKGHETIADLLLQMEGIDLGPDGRNQTPLTTALESRQLNIAWSLMNAERRRNSDNDNGQSLLSWAAESDKRDVVRRLNDLYTINPNLQDEGGQTALSRAAERGNLSMVGLLLENKAIDVNVKNRDGSTPLSQAAKNQHKNVVQLLAAKDNVTLHSLVQAGDLQLVDFLLHCDIDIGHRDIQGQTLLHIAVIFKQLQIAERLLERGAETKAEDTSGKTPLALAVQHNLKSFVELLLLKSACMKGIQSKDWQTTYNSYSPEAILHITDRANGGVQVRFVDSVHPLQDEPKIARSLL